MAVFGSSGGYKTFVKRTRAVFGLPTNAPKADGRKQSVPPAGTDTKISQALDDVLDHIRRDGATRVLISGDRAFRDSVVGRAPELETEWVSCLVEDQKAGAANPDQADFATFDTVLCGGGAAAVSYRHAVARMAEVDAGRPVHWVANNWEFCGGTLPVPVEMDDAEALLFSHFQHYFGIKDPLQFRIEIYHGAERKHFTRILQPNQSLVIRLSDHFPERRHPACIATFVSHPILTRGRHYRLRVCADVFWRNSHTTLHSAHEFKRSPDHKFEFRASKELVRSGEFVMTVPNYARDLGANPDMSMSGGTAHGVVRRDPANFIEEVKFERNGDAEPFFGLKYRGYGGSFWYGLEGPQACSAGHDGSLSANHHASVPVADMGGDWSPSSEEQAHFAWLRGAGFMVEPYPVPVVAEDAPLQYLIEFDSANPQFNKLRLHFFGADGAFLGEMPYVRQERGPFSPSAIARTWADSRRDAVTLAIVTPDWDALKIRRKGFKLQINLIVQDRRTGDRDVTEFQNCWRNCGTIVEGMMGFAGPDSTVYGRTNLFARVRTSDGYRTGLLTTNGSGNRNYRREAELDVTVYNAQGESKTAALTIPPFGWRLDWIDGLIPGLADHLGASGNGAMIAGSKNADLNCHIVTTSPRGAVSLQHMWGY
jgi:hypothetical protein